MSYLHLLSTPARIHLAHVRRGLDRGHEFEADIGSTDKEDDRADNDGGPVSMRNDAADEDVNCKD